MQWEERKVLGEAFTDANEKYALTVRVSSAT
jgi:hypothetical protein